MRRAHSNLALFALAGALFGCAPPTGTRTGDPDNDNPNPDGALGGTCNTSSSSANSCDGNLVCDGALCRLQLGATGCSADSDCAGGRECESVGGSSDRVCCAENGERVQDDDLCCSGERAPGGICREPGSGVAGCGTEGNQCCRSGSACGNELTCGNSGFCQPCGRPGGRCCPGDAADEPCDGGTTCTVDGYCPASGVGGDGTDPACNDVGDECCEGDRCDGGLSCFDGVCDDDPCPGLACGECANTGGCVWCEASDSCVAGNELGGFNGTCEQEDVVFVPNGCDEVPCSTHAGDCAACADAAGCGWCGSSCIQISSSSGGSGRESGTSEHPGDAFTVEAMTEAGPGTEMEALSVTDEGCVVSAAVAFETAASLEGTSFSLRPPSSDAQSPTSGAIAAGGDPWQAQGLWELTLENPTEAELIVDGWTLTLTYGECPSAPLCSSGDLITSEGACD